MESLPEVQNLLLIQASPNRLEIHIPTRAGVSNPLRDVPDPTPPFETSNAPAAAGLMLHAPLHEARLTLHARVIPSTCGQTFPSPNLQIGPIGLAPGQELRLGNALTFFSLVYTCCAARMPLSVLWACGAAPQNSPPLIGRTEAPDSDWF